MLAKTNKNRLSVAVLIAVSIPIVSFAMAQPLPSATPPAEPSASAPAVRDSVILKDGTVIEGKVVEQVPGSYVVIETTGSMRTISWDRVGEVRSTKPPEPKAPNPTISASPMPSSPPCKPGQDCSHTQTTVDSSAMGITASSETVEIVGTPGNASVGFALNGGLQLSALKSGGPLVGAALGLSVPIMVGSVFPGKDGGGWSGLSLDPGVYLSGEGGKLGETQPGTSDSMGLLTVRFGGFVGYQYLHFGPMEDIDGSRLQRGFGLRVGSFLGGQYQKSNLTMHVAQPSKSGYPSYREEKSTDEKTDFSWGPMIGLVMPSRNAGTSHVRTQFISVMILPVADVVTVSLSGGVSF